VGFRIQIENKNIIERDGRASSSQAEVADSCNRPSLPARERRTNDDQGGARGRRSRSRPFFRGKCERDNKTHMGASTIIVSYFSTVSHQRHSSSVFKMYSFIWTRQYCFDTRSSFNNPSTLGERFLEYLEQQGQPAEYSKGELGELYVLLDWIASCMVYGRPLEGIPVYHFFELPNEQKELLVKLLSPVFRILFVQDQNFSQLEEIMAKCGHLAELCIFDREQMEQAEHLVYHVPHLMPFIVLSTGKGTKQEAEYERLPKLDEGRVLATVWDCIRRKVGAFPYIFMYQ
jgi:hypothetical protein